MAKFLIRRRNRFGQYVHLTTFDYEPDQYTLESNFGPGEYNILVSQPGIVGLQKVKDIVVPWNTDLVEVVQGKPTFEYVREKYGLGNYFVLTNCHAQPMQVFADNLPHDVAWQNLQDGISAMKNLSVIVRVKMPWV